jgi:hypothetical protein
LAREAVPLVAVVRERGCLGVVATTEWGAIQSTINVRLLLSVEFYNTWGGPAGPRGAVALVFEMTMSLSASL